MNRTDQIRRARARLVVNADDFGLTPGVCEGILTAHDRGIVTSTSVLTVAPAFPRYATALRDSGLGVGLHVCVVGEDPPLLTANEIPTLVDRRGRFPLTWKEFCGRATIRRVDRDDLRREFEAQLEAATRAGLVLDHIDSHQNLHLWPTVGSAALELATRHSVRLIRVAESQRWTAPAAAVRLLGRHMRSRAAKVGIAVPDRSEGFDNSGAMDLPTLVSLIDSFSGATGIVDLTVHPGARQDVDRDRYRWGYAWADELDALCRPEARHAVERAGLTLATFSEATHTEGSS